MGGNAAPGRNRRHCRKPEGGTRYAARMSSAALRRRALLLLWLVLALLPVRGWAGLAMHLPKAEHMAAAAPCHGMDATQSADTADANRDGSAAACSLCELCHGALLLPVMALAEPERLARTWPAAVPAEAPSPAPSPLFRPPRR